MTASCESLWTTTPSRRSEDESPEEDLLQVSRQGWRSIWIFAARRLVGPSTSGDRQAGEALGELGRRSLGFGVLRHRDDQDAAVAQIGRDHSPRAVKRALAHRAIARAFRCEALPAGAAPLSPQGLDGRVVCAALSLGQLVLDGAPHLRYAQDRKGHYAGSKCPAAVSAKPC